MEIDDPPAPGIFFDRNDLINDLSSDRYAVSLPENSAESRSNPANNPREYHNCEGSTRSVLTRW